MLLVGIRKPLMGFGSLCLLHALSETSTRTLVLRTETRDHHHLSKDVETGPPPLQKRPHLWGPRGLLHPRVVYFENTLPLVGTYRLWSLTCRGLPFVQHTLLGGPRCLLDTRVFKFEQTSVSKSGPTVSGVVGCRVQKRSPGGQSRRDPDTIGPRRE